MLYNRPFPQPLQRGFMPHDFSKYQTEEQFQADVKEARKRLIERSGITEPDHYAGLSNAGLIHALLDATGRSSYAELARTLPMFPAILRAAPTEPEQAEALGHCLKGLLDQAVSEGRIRPGSYLETEPEQRWTDATAPSGQRRGGSSPTR